MAICNSTSSLLQSTRFLFFLSHLFIFIFFLLPSATPITFNFSDFQSNIPNLSFQPDAFANQAIQLTRNQLDRSITNSVGRVTYTDPVKLWDSATNTLTDFSTRFSFSINALNSSLFGDGLAFFLAPIGSVIPNNSFGGYLGLFDRTSAFNSSENSMVAVEFDTFFNPWDPSADHVGINVNSIESRANVSWTSNMKDGRRANAWVSYNASTQNLSVFLTYADNPVFNGNSSVSYVVDLRDVLPEWVEVGFSAATGDWVELHTIYSWEFSSSLEVNGGGKNQIGLVVGLVVGVVVLICGLGLVFYVWKKKTTRREIEDTIFDVSMDDDFQKGTGPKRFTYKELATATNDFAEAGKLGEGGFGGVYKGILRDSNFPVAVKRVSRGSKQGKKEYVSEVKIISRLRHRNLVQLVGWCHERGDFLLVYELLPNGSLDTHLFSGKSLLTWVVRYKIVTGLASALLYLHEEWEQCVVHRDIKSSNIMLDSGFNAKLGDFGLARLVDHDLGSQTTVLAGTMGYLAPECVTTGKASKESDVYSFGVVALEIACGRKPVEPRVEASKVRLVEWVWNLYGSGKLLEAADERLNTDFDEQQIQHLMVVGLWCAHPDFNLRPSVRQVINVLNFEAPLPSLPSKMPVPTYYAPPMNMCSFSYTSSAGITDSERHRSQGFSSSDTTDSSKSTMSPGASSVVALLHSEKADM